MESVGSNSTQPSPNNHTPHQLPQPVADRILRALHNTLHLLHRSSDSIFFVLGATGNVYIVTLTSRLTCTCPDFTTPCKHILFVLIRVLGVSLSDTCLTRRTLRPCQLNRLLETPTLSASLAGPDLRERFHRLFFCNDDRNRSKAVADHREIEEGTVCPVCLEDISPEKKNREGGEIVCCGNCRNAIHEECLMRWKKSRGRRPAICVICRARWRDLDKMVGGNEYRYLNLGVYVNQDHTNRGGDYASSCGS